MELPWLVKVGAFLSFCPCSTIGIFAQNESSMATSFITSFPSDYKFSSDILNVELQTDATKVVITLSADGTTLFSTTLFAFDGVVTVYNLREIVEIYMLEKGVSLAMFCLEYSANGGADSGSANLNVVYCSHIMPISAADYSSKFFLTSLQSKRTYPNSVEYLPIIHGISEFDVDAHCVFATSSGEVLSTTITLWTTEYEENGVDTLIIKYNDIVLALSQDRFDVDRLLAYTINIGQRHMTYYVHAVNPAVAFTFRNCFNALESVALFGITTTKTKIERSIASISSGDSFYDQSTEKDYEFQTAPLTTEEGALIEQLFESQKVYIGTTQNVSNINSLPVVLITDSSCEITDSNADLPRVKFTWRYADKLPHHINVPESDSNVFDDEFSYQFT